jgi:hypothetical protein
MTSPVGGVLLVVLVSGGSDAAGSSLVVETGSVSILSGAA